MEDILLMQVLDALRDLSHKDYGIQLGKHVVLINDSVKQLATVHAENKPVEINQGKCQFLINSFNTLCCHKTMGTPIHSRLVLLHSLSSVGV